MTAIEAVVDDIHAVTGRRLDPSSGRSVTGGCINAAWRVDGDAGPVFLKTNAAERLDMFETEADGLVALARADGLRVPEVFGWGATDGTAWLLLEWIEAGRATGATQRRLGRGLAAQHRRSAGAFGWHRDNWIGATPQENAGQADWAAFFANHRLAFQLDLLETSGFGGALAAPGRRLQEAVPALLAGHAPPPSLLHGDLWGGNWACDGTGAPFVFDPAVYYGDREADLAMTRLFGGFGADFYAAYEDAWPLPPGHERRGELYNLYHVLNHVNLFGAGYVGQARAMIGRLLAAIAG